MKKLSLVAALGLAALFSSVSHAATATSTFNVNMTLTPKCYVNMVTGTPADVATTDVTLTYTSFQNTVSQGSTGFNVRCTNTFPYSIAVTSDGGTVSGIAYFLKLVAGSTPSYVSAAGGGTLASQTGNGSDKPYAIGVEAAAGQAGTCAVEPCTSTQAHTITVSY